MICCPTGRPRVCAGWARVNVKMTVSGEMRRLLARGAVVQDRGFRKVGVGSLGALVGMEESPSVRFLRAAAERVPRW